MTLPTIRVDAEVDGVLFRDISKLRLIEKTTTVVDFTLTSLEDDAPFNLAGKTLRFVGKKHINDADADAIFNVGGVLTTPASGKVQGSFSGSLLTRVIEALFEVNIWNTSTPISAQLPNNRIVLGLDILPALKTGGF